MAVGMSKNRGKVCVVATSHSAEKLDPGLTSAGRLDKLIYTPMLKTEEDRQEALYAILQGRWV